MSDMIDKPDDPTSIGESIGIDGLSAFFQKCEGKVWPIIVRPEIGQYMAAMPPEAQAILFEGMHPAYKNAIAYSEGWLDKYDGVAHTCHCGMCSAPIECKEDNDNAEVGAFFVLQHHDLDMEVGGVVFPVCQTCADGKDDHALNQSFSDNIGGTYTKRSLTEQGAKVEEPAPPAEEKPSEAPSQEDVNLLVGK